ncbi:MAG TPA: hypothetical protein VNP98_17355 [Chthoniobacterales bacterium]|nr:hypothetical protein [Chthoniobacterales bacterium]
MIFLAQSLDRFTPGVIGWTAIGVFTVIAIAAVTFTALNQGKKWFGRQPTFDEIIKTLLSVEDFKIYKEEQRLRNVGLEEQISNARHTFDERVNSDLKRTLETFEVIFRRGGERDQIVAKLRDTVSRLQERTETHLRKLDQYDTKLDNLLREVSAAAARGVKSAQ